MSAAPVKFLSLLCLILSYIHLVYLISVGKLVSERIYSTKCFTNKDCKQNEYCFPHLNDSFCMCQDGYLPDKENKTSPVKCLKEATNFGDYCEKDIQCQGAFGQHAICKIKNQNPIGTCECEDIAHYKENYCFRTAYIGDFCQTKENCLLATNDIQPFCDYGKCSCPPLHHSIKNGKDCAKTSELYGPCVVSEGCITLNSECKDGFCKCGGDFVPNYLNFSCLFVANKILDPCNEDVQCLTRIPLSLCVKDKGHCECRVGAHVVDGLCWRTAKLSEPCTNNNECISSLENRDGIVCKDYICQCKTDYWIDELTGSCKTNITTKSSKNSGDKMIPSNFLFNLFILSLYCLLL